MSGRNVSRSLLGSLAVLALCVSKYASAAELPNAGIPVATDVVLTGGGLLTGRVINPHGFALANVPVSLRYMDREVAVARTDSQGNFAMGGLRGGVHQVVSAGVQGLYRLWTPGTGPPSSSRGVLLVAPLPNVANGVRPAAYTAQWPEQASGHPSGVPGMLDQVAQAAGPAGPGQATRGDAPDGESQVTPAAYWQGSEQGCRSGLQEWLNRPWVIAGVTATAVAVPIAIYGSRRPSIIINNIQQPASP